MEQDGLRDGRTISVHDRRRKGEYVLNRGVEEDEKIEEKEMIDPAYIEMLKEGGTLLLVYHLRNDKTHE